MILRVRTNISTIRIEVDDSLTVESLILEILKKLEVTNAATVTLSLDINGNKIISRDLLATLSSLGLRHGDEVHVLDRFEVEVVEKDYINDSHDLIKAGRKLKVIEAVKESKAEVTAAPEPAREPSPAPPPPCYHEKVDTSVNRGNYAKDASHDGWYAENEEDSLRSPDQVQKMQLIDEGNPSPLLLTEPRRYQAPLLQAEDYRELEAMRTELLLAGLDRREVAVIVEERANHLLSDR